MKNRAIEINDDVRKNNSANTLVIKDSDDDGAIGARVLHQIINEERLKHDLKIGKLFPNGVRVI
jgi:hypothetical protein